MKEIEFNRLRAFLSPFLVNSRQAIYVVLEDGVSLYSQKLDDKGTFSLKAPLPEGTRVIVTVDRTISIYIESEYLAEQEQQKIMREERALERKQLEEELQARSQKEAIEFNKALSIPVNWSVDIKVVMSGLSANSWGSGTNRRSVNHIRLNEDLVAGRIKRKAGDFLCGADHGKNEGYTDPEDYLTSDRKVSCKACLKTAERFRQN